MPDRVRSRTATAMPSEPARVAEVRPAGDQRRPEQRRGDERVDQRGALHLAGRPRSGEDREAQHRHAEADDEAPEGEASEHVRDEVAPEVEA